MAPGSIMTTNKQEILANLKMNIGLKLQKSLVPPEFEDAVNDNNI